jgi:peptide/nickel transport system permease protein
MKAYIARKILHALLPLFAIVTTLFILFHVLPIGTADRVISPALDETSRHRLKRTFGLNKPLHVQFVIALLLLMVLSYRLNLFPTGGMHTPNDKADAFDLLDVSIDNRLYNKGIQI